MTSVPPYGIAVPMLLGGKQAPRLADRLRPLGFNVTPLSPKSALQPPPRCRAAS